MTQEYTPDTDDAIDLIVAGMGTVIQLGIAPVGYPCTETDAVEAAKRWLAAHDAQIRADAWDEGHTRGWMDAMESVQADTELSRALAGVSPNPYKSEEA